VNKQHWNTVIIDESILSKKIFEWTDDSYNLVAAGLKKPDRDMLER